MRYPKAADCGPQPTVTDSAWAVGVEVDLHTAMALSRATTRALLELSPL